MNASKIVTGAEASAAATGREDLIDRYLPVYDLAITEHLVVQASPEAAYQAAAELDFLTVRSPLLSAAFFVRDVPARLRGRAAKPPPELRLAAGTAGLPGWVYLGAVPGLEIAFGAVGKFWQPNIEWRDVPAGQFAGFAEPGWGKIACHFLIRSAGPGSAVVSYECRTATTDPGARSSMARYWWIIRPFVGHIMRATLRTIRANAERPAQPG
jgi:hypothetical protein